jgi:hypothetical protein
MASTCVNADKSLRRGALLVRCRAYVARDSFWYLSQPLPFDCAQGKPAGLTFGTPTGPIQRKTIWEFIGGNMQDGPLPRRGPDQVPEMLGAGGISAPQLR